MSKYIQVQQKFKGFNELTYEYRLKQLAIYWEKRRLCGDLIKVYKILNERKEWTKPNFFSLPWTQKLRKHAHKLFKPSCRTKA